MFFRDIIGQSKVKPVLAGLASGGRLPHAMMLLGPSGGGSLAVALAFVQFLQCEYRQPDDTEPCGECPACRKAAVFSHPDIHFSFPAVGSGVVSTDFLKEWRSFLTGNPYAGVNDWLQQLGAENKQGNITKDECNAIIKKLSLKKFEGRYKILLMWLPEYLGKEGNRLLKLVEEPPEDTVFLFVAENTELILPTLLSRCQLVRLDPLSDEEVSAALTDRLKLDPARASEIAFLAGGDFGEAIRTASSQENSHTAMFVDWLRKCWKGNAVELVQWTEGFARTGRETQKQFLLYGLHFMRELMALSATGNSTLRLKPDELATAQNMARVLDFDKISRLVEVFNDNIFHIERNANPKILMLDTSVGVNTIMKG